MIDDNTWDMVLGKSGRLPGPVGEEIKSLAKSQDREFFEGNPQDLYADELDGARTEMEENGWDLGPDEEELFEMAMHPEQYRAYKSGDAKKSFEADLEARKAEASQPVAGAPEPTAEAPAAMPRNLNIEINGEKFDVRVSYPDLQSADSSGNGAGKAEAPTSAPAATPGANGVHEIIAPIEGNFMLTKNSSENPVKIGDRIQEGDLIGYIEAMKVYNAIHADKSGVVSEICIDNGSHVDEDDLLIRLS